MKLTSTVVRCPSTIRTVVASLRPWIITNEGDIWFSQSKDGRSVYAVLFDQKDWPRGERREFMINSVRAADETKVSVLGQNDNIVEYMGVDPESRFEQTENVLKISVVRAQRLSWKTWNQP